MTLAGYRHRILVIDRSGSISRILAGQQSGLGEFIDSEAALPGKLTFSVWDFDSEIRCVHAFAGADAVRGYKIKPRDMTAMYDAIAEAVIAEGAYLSSLADDERPEDVSVIICSDGLENASVRFTGPQVAELLKVQREAYNWRVLYMGTNQDALAEGQKFGQGSGQSVNYAFDDVGARNAWRGSANLLKRAPVAAASAGGYDYNEQERELAATGTEDEPQEQGDSA